MTDINIILKGRIVRISPNLVSAHDTDSSRELITDSHFDF